MMFKDIQISFIVLTYNRSDALLKVLHGLAAQCGNTHEVIIADDGSCAAVVDAWVKKMPSFRCPVQHVWHSDLGFTASRARNLGALVSHGRYLVFLDGDCVPCTWFTKAHETLALQGCFVNGSRVLLNPTLSARILADEVDVVKMKPLEFLKQRVRGGVNKLTQLVYWPGAPLRVQTRFQWKNIRSCNFALWKSDFVFINGFDETFEGWGHEDADLVLRLHHAGIHRINGYFGTEVYHLWHPQNSRTQEHVNCKRVLERMQSGITMAISGLRENPVNADVVVTQLN